ncbi:TPA: cyclic nucleotide-binding domain-containing protein [Candidatus Poribacteria bacterium]|nr:cyclic nucleotide-binding domain-containing protein [Candidatus Poribacteria bacterium]
MNNSLHTKFNFLLSTPIFSSLPSEELKKIALVAEEQALAAGETLFKQGDVGNSLYIIMSGQVKVFRTSDDGIETVLAHQGPGCSIGEMALLTGDLRSASVQATEDSTMIAIGKQDFERLLADNPYLAQVFIKIIAEYVRKADLRIEQGTSQELALREFLSQQRQRPEAKLIGKSRNIVALNRVIEEVAAVDNPTLIVGEVGTEHSMVAQLIHEKSHRKEQALLIVDCATIPTLIPSSQSQESEEKSFLMEISQDSAIFGHESSVFSFAKSRRIGYLEVAHSGTLVLENVDKLQRSLQAKLAAYLRDGNFYRWGGSDMIRADVRMLATSSIDLAQAVEQGRFDKDLYEQLSGQSVSIPPLRGRKKDLSALVGHFILKYNQESQKEVKGVTPEAMNLIMSYDWPGNVEELESVIRRGVHISEDEMLTPQEIFIGLQPLEGEKRFNLFRFERFQQIFESQLFPRLLQIGTVVFFGLVLLLGLLGPQNPTSNIALILTWAIWWPVLVLSFLFAARFWCGICPIAAIAEWINHLCNLGFKAPSFLRKYGIYFNLAGFALIIWEEQATEMNAQPRATSFLLLGILTAAIVTGLLFERRAWCRYLCPLGGMASTFATTSIIEFRGNLDVCNNECSTHACFVGTDTVKGCPMYQGAFSLQSNEYCILCGNCIKNCEKQSPRINLRPPAIELAAKTEQLRAKAFSSRLGLALFVPLLIGSLFAREFKEMAIYERIEQILDTDALTPLVTLVVFSLMMFGVLWAGGIAAIRRPGQSIDRFCWLALAFIPLTFAGELAHQLARLLLWAGQLIPTLGRQIDFDHLQRFGIQATPAMVYLLQIMIILFGAIITLIVGKQTIANYINGQRTFPLWVLRMLVLVLSITYLILFSQGA